MLAPFFMLKEPTMTEQKQEWRFYGRRAGRKLNTTRKEVMDTLLPLLHIEEERITKEHNVDPTSLFKAETSKTIFEIGFGSGERLLEMLGKHADTGFIGAEPFTNGVSSFLKDLHNTYPETLPENIRLYTDDAIPLAQSFQENSIDEIHVLNPDPWHKARHHKRRIINQSNLDIFAKIIKSGGKLIMSTDVPDLAEWMVTEASMHDAFEWDAETMKDWIKPPSGWVHTRYEGKRAKGADSMRYLIFTRK